MGPLADLTDTPGHDGTDAWSASADPLCTADALELASLIWCSDAGTRPNPSQDMLGCSGPGGLTGDAFGSTA